MSKGKRVKKNKNKSKLKLLIWVVLICILSFVSYFIYSFEKNTHVSSNKNLFDDIELDENMPDLKEVDGITNILLLGSDARTLDETSRSDAILILTIDDIHKNLKLTSIMRDSYVKIPGHGEQKINHAFFLGGSDLLMKTIENNFSLKLDKFAIINFTAFQNLVDSVGGIDVTIKPNEVDEVNKFIIEVNGKNAHLLKGSGLQHLDGQQALSYSRIRHVGNGSYERTQRQRNVISLLINNLKETQVIKYPSIASELMQYVKTNMGIDEILNYAYTIYKINNFDIKQLQMPLTELSTGQEFASKGWVLLMDRPQNAEVLNDFIFDDKTYDKSKLDYTSYKNEINNYISRFKTPTNIKPDIYQPHYTPEKATEFTNKSNKNSKNNTSQYKVPSNKIKSQNKPSDKSTNTNKNKNKPTKPSKPNKPNKPSKPTKPNKPNKPSKPEIPKEDNKNKDNENNNSSTENPSDNNNSNNESTNI